MSCMTGYFHTTACTCRCIYVHVQLHVHTVLHVQPVTCNVHVLVHVYVVLWFWSDFQVVLCFSPVGSTLRVRSRKFPAVVNCTCIDWFHEWPQEALMSVSKRFLSEVELVTVRWYTCINVQYLTALMKRTCLFRNNLIQCSPIHIHANTK